MTLLRHYLKTMLFIVAIGTLSIMSLEGMARLNWVEEHTVVPSVGANNNYVDIQIAGLNKFMQTHDSLDCIFIGTSLVVQDFNPDVVALAYQTETGEALTCYNFGIPNSRMATLAYLTEYLTKKYHPRYVVVGISLISFKRSTESDTELQQSDWFTMVKNEPSLEGRLIENSQAYRSYLRYEAWLSPEFRDNLDIVQNLQYQFTQSGHFASLNTIWDMTQPVEPNTAVPAAYPLTEEVAGLEHIMALQDTYPQTQLIVVSMPLHENYIQANLGFRDRYNRLVSEYITPSNLIFFDMTAVAALPDELWRDNAHLNANGALWFSYWFGQTLANWQTNPSLRLDTQFNLETVPPITELIQARSYWCASEKGYSANDRLIDANAVLYNPNLADKVGVEYYEDNIRTFLCIAEMTNVQRADTYQMWSLLDTMQFADELTSTSAQQDSLQQWAQTYQPADLKNAGIDYLIFKEGWLQQLPSEAQAQLNDPTQYRQIHHISSPAIGPFYFVLEPIVE